MDSSPLETYLAGQDQVVAPLVRALDRAIRDADPELDVAIKYQMLMYSLNRDWRTWVCAIGTTSKLVALRFLYGVLLEDPKGVLRAGTSVLKTWDFPFDGGVDDKAVGAYVREAVARYPEYKQNSAEVRAASHGSVKATRRPASAPRRARPESSGKSVPRGGRRLIDQ